jgi:antagonist of KipI
MIRILDAGPLTTVQDLGRAGQLRYGIPPSGPMDRDSFVLANRLVDNDDGDAGLEGTLIGPRFEAMAPCAIAVTGAAASVTVNGAPAKMWRSLTLRAGDVVKLGPAMAGVRTYVAFSGGVGVAPVLGSRATYVRGRLGGWHGRALRKGDEISLGAAALPPDRWIERPPDTDPGAEPTLRVVLGPQADRFRDDGIRTFLSSAYEVLPQSDRMGARLRGPRIAHARGHDIISDGIPLGGVQVPGDGQPIVLLVDRQSTGGYTKLATVCSFDIGRLAQLRPGRAVRFAAVAVDEAHQLHARHRAALDNVAIAHGQRHAREAV